MFDEQCSLGTDSCEFLLNISYWTLRTIGKNVHIKLYETERRKKKSSETKYEKGYLQMKNTKWFLNNFNYKSTDIFIYRINITYILLLDNIL